MEGCPSSFGIQVSLVVECVETSEEQTTHYPFSVVAFKDIMSRLTMFRPKRVATDLKR
jgi:hypothetical protein